MTLKKIIPHIFLILGVALTLALAPGCVTTSQPGEILKDPPARLVMMGSTDLGIETLIQKLIAVEDRGIKHLRLDITSGGGSILGMWKLIDMLESLKAQGVKIHTHASGVIASAAVPIYLAGTYRTMSPTCYWMIHPHTGSQTICDDIDPSFCTMLADWTALYAKYVEERTKFTFNEMVELMEGDSNVNCHFFNADAAIEWGVAHEITYG